MDLSGKIVVITGGVSGIGLALARKCLEIGARVAICDLDEAHTRRVSDELGCLGIGADVSREDAVQGLVALVEERLGPIDIFVSNAGIYILQPDHAASASDADWMRNWAVHVMAHVYAARALLPGMISRGSGRFVSVASAAGLLNQVGNAAYSASKHAAVSFAESLAIEHKDDGIEVSVVCPEYVATPLIGLSAEDAGGRLLSPEAVADAIVSGLREKRFLILPHEEVQEHAIRRAGDHDRWIKGMQDLRRRVKETGKYLDRGGSGKD
jgi:NAD(P)-dependent dehydrogenase (short-subunit alcohol dehydrogenase family)